jgi:hypothetical protein
LSGAGASFDKKEFKRNVAGSGASRTIWQGKKKSDKNFDDHITTI